MNGTFEQMAFDRSEELANALHQAKTEGYEDDVDLSELVEQAALACEDYFNGVATSAYIAASSARKGIPANSPEVRMILELQARIQQLENQIEEHDVQRHRMVGGLDELNQLLTKLNSGLLELVSTRKALSARKHKRACVSRRGELRCDCASISS